MIIQWQWVMFAFLAGITLTSYLEIRRRRKLSQRAWGLYLLPLFSLLLTIGIWLAGFETAISQVETAVISSPQSPKPTRPIQPAAVKTLPSPQISIYEREIDQSPAIGQSAPVQTAVYRLQIPALNLDKPVHTVPLENGIWHVADLGSDVGWLETTAVHPNDEQAMVFVGHMTFANQNLLEHGAFADIPTLPYGTAVILETTDSSHTYLVDSVRRVSPDNTDALYQESGNSILLLTCADWNPQAGIYENRLLVRASKLQSETEQ